MRCTAVAALGSLVVGCYSPNIPVSGGGGNEANDTTGTSETDDTAIATMADPATTLTEPSGGNASDQETSAGSSSGITGISDSSSVDAPPTAENLRVNGMVDSAELSISGQVLLEVEVADDVGIDRVEYHAGARLISTETEAPYDALVLFTSADNGDYSITATAYDTAGQPVQAGPVTLNVTIDGGATLQLREDVFVSRTFGDASGGAPGWWVGAPSVSIVDGEHVIVAGSSRYQGGGFTKSRWTAVRHDGDLLEAWQREYPASMVGSSLDRQTTSSIVPRGQQLLLMEVTTTYSQYPSNTVYPLNPDNGSLGSHIEFAVGDLFQSPPARSLAVDGDGNLLALTTEGQLVKVDPAGEVVWQADALSGLPGEHVSRVTIGAMDVIYVDTLGDTTSLRKFSTAGDVEWTQENGGISQPLADGTIVSVGGWFGGAEVPTLLHRDADGVELIASELAVDAMVPLDMCATPVGDLVIVGSRNYGPYPEGGAVARATVDGEVIWSADLDIGATEFATATGVATTAAGRLYVAGVANVTGGGGASVGDAWVIELML